MQGMPRTSGERCRGSKSDIFFANMSRCLISVLVIVHTSIKADAHRTRGILARVRTYPGLWVFLCVCLYCSSEDDMT